MFSGLLVQQSPQPLKHPFIAEIQYWAHPEKAICLVSGQFELEYFADNLYPEFGIALPDQLINAVSKRKAEFLVGRLMAKHALGGIGYSKPCSRIAINEHRAPIWPLGVVGSISHDRSSAICVAAKQTIVPLLGLDIEELLDEMVATQIASTVHNKQELALLLAANFSPNVATTLLFSAKESLFKALYPTVRCYFGFEQAKLSKVHLQNQCLIFCLEDTFARKYGLEKCYCVEYRQFTSKIITLLA